MKRKFRFNFNRVLVLLGVASLGNGNYQIRISGGREIKIKSVNIHFTKTRFFDDTSTLVVDLGLKGVKTKNVIIAADRIQRIKDYFSYNNILFPSNL